jgi:AhpD family alkylhydroperoxidase
MEINMHKSTGILLTLAAAMSLGVLGAMGPVASAEDAPAQATYRDIEKTLGIVPGFFKLFPEVGIAGAWAEFKSVQLNPNTKLNGKTKELIGLALASQIPCHYCVYFHTAAAKANGATDEEIREAVAMAAIVRHWSTVLNGMQVDLAAFKRETDTVLRLAGEKAATAGKAQ